MYMSECVRRNEEKEKCVCVLTELVCVCVCVYVMEDRARGAQWARRERERDHSESAAISRTRCVAAAESAHSTYRSQHAQHVGTQARRRGRTTGAQRHCDASRLEPGECRT